MRSAACRFGTAAGYPAEMPPYLFWRRDKNMKRRTILPEVPGIPNGSAPLSETYRPNEIYRVTLTGIFVNILLSAGKLIAGILGRSGAMLADAIHSISDFATDIIVLLSVNTTPTATKEEKPRYEYGKHETVVTVLIGLALLGVAIVIFVDSAHRIRLDTLRHRIPAAGPDSRRCRCRLHRSEGVALPVHPPNGTTGKEPGRYRQRLASPQRRILLYSHLARHRRRPSLRRQMGHHGPGGGHCGRRPHR